VTLNEDRISIEDARIDGKELSFSIAEAIIAERAERF
jgi:hypothetical protein